MAHVIVTRFSVPRSGDPATADRHRDPAWLERRLELLRTFFVPSVSRFDVPVILLCSTVSAPLVAEAVADHAWAQVEIQDDWFGGWTGNRDQIVTRLDSDDALHDGWFEAVDAAPATAEVVCTREFLRLEPARNRLCAYRRRVPSPLAAFRYGRNPYEHDHADLARRFRVHWVEGAQLLQVFHGGNLASHRPSWYRRRQPLDRLRAFGLDPGKLDR